MRRFFLDLFSGIGGFALGAEWAGLRFDEHYFSEIDDYAQRVYRKRFPDAIAIGDIRNIRGSDLPAGEWIIAGGFPCQDISVAGKGAGLAGERSGLWYEYARIIGELRPSFAIMENVGALAFRGLDSVLGSLAALGYDAEWQDIRASDVGAPHRRERIWIVAYPSGHDAQGIESREFDHGGREKSGKRQAGPCGASKVDVADTKGERLGEAGQLRCVESEEWTSGSRWALADTTSSGLQIGRQSGQPDGDTETRAGLESEPERCSQAMADATNGWNVRRDWQLEPAQGEMREHRGSPSHGCGEWWATEPDVGGSPDGLPPWLDRHIGVECSYAENHRRVKALRELWSDHVSQTLRRAIGGFERLQQADILFSFLRQYQDGVDEARLLVEGEEVSEGFLRSLRREALSARSPHRPKQKEQFSGEHPDPLQVVPRLLAFDGPPHWAGNGWEDATTRVATGVKNRVDRLRCLGNSIVPQIAELIFRQIIIYETDV